MIAQYFDDGLSQILIYITRANRGKRAGSISLFGKMAGWRK